MSARCLRLVGHTEPSFGMEVESKAILDNSTDSDSESEVEKIFIGTPKQSEMKFREVANLLHTVKPLESRASTTIPNDSHNVLASMAPQPSPCPNIGRFKDLLFETDEKHSLSTGTGI
jgi:hypothetical protein